MPAYVPNLFAVSSSVLAADVVTTGTFTVNYPTGTSQQTFLNGLASATGSYVIVNKNDKYLASGSTVPYFQLSFGASNITVTNSTGFTIKAGSTIDIMLERQDDTQVVLLAFPINLPSITAAQDVVTNFQPGISGVIEDMSFLVNAPVTTASKLASLNANIDTVDCTGGVVALTSAACTPMGALIDSSQFTAGNVLKPDSRLRIKATSVTAFVEGSGTLFVRVRRAFQ